MSNSSFILWVTEQVRTKVAAAAWSGFLFFGGLIFLLYYAHINFTPELELSSSVTVLAAAAITGGFYLIGFSVVMIVPGMIWSAVMLKVRAYRALFYPEERLARMRVLLWLIIPLVVVVAATAVLVYFTDKLGAVEPGTGEPNFWRRYEVWLGLAPALLASVPAFLTTTGLFYSKEKRRERGADEGPRPSRARLLLRAALRSLGYWVIYAVSCLCFLLPAVLVMLIVRGSDNVSDASLLFGVLGLFILTVLVNSLVTWVSESEHAPRWRAAIGVAAAFAVLVFLEWAVAASSLMMGAYGLGHLPNSFAVLKPEGCALLSQVGLATCPEEKAQCRVDNLFIYSRLGASFYLRGVGRDGRAVDFTLPRDAVLSWGSEPNTQRSGSFYDHLFRTSYLPVYSVLIDGLGGCGPPGVVVSPRPLRLTPEQAREFNKLYADAETHFDLRQTQSAYLAAGMIGSLPARYRRMADADGEWLLGEGGGNWALAQQKYPGTAAVALSDVSINWEGGDAVVAYKYFGPEGGSHLVLVRMEKDEGVWVVASKMTAETVRAVTVR